jgi:hypothetical protein
MNSLTGKILLVGGLLVAVILFFGFVGCNRIDAGCVGIKAHMVGAEKGVSKNEYVSGWCFYNKFTAKVYEFPTYQQHTEYEPFTVPSKGGTVFTVHPTFNYNVNPGEVAAMFTRFRLPLDQLQNGYLKNALLVSLRETTNTFTVDSILNNLSGYDAAVLGKLNEKLAPYFTVSTFTSGLTPDESLAKVISAKSQVIQEAIQLENQQKKIRVQVENDILEASRDSAVKVKGAKAEAISIQLQQDALSRSPQYVELIKAQKWDGKLPQNTFGNSGSMFMSVGANH